jgi:hypothetical protein
MVEMALGRRAMYPRWRWLVIVGGMLLAGCEAAPRANGPRLADQARTVTVQCTVTGTSSDAPCQNEARRACDAEHVRLREIVSRNVVPATQGVDQTSMPITEYAVSYLCNG